VANSHVTSSVPCICCENLKKKTTASASEWREYLVILEVKFDQTKEWGYKGNMEQLYSLLLYLVILEVS
jgi:hypothetical protein